MDNNFLIQKILNKQSIDEIKKFCSNFDYLFFEQNHKTLYMVTLYYDTKTRITNLYLEPMMKSQSKFFLYHDLRKNIESFNFALNLSVNRFRKLWKYRDKIK